jgi:hypothetical protein
VQNVLAVMAGPGNAQSLTCARRPPVCAVGIVTAMNNRCHRRNHAHACTGTSVGGGVAIWVRDKGDAPRSIVQESVIRDGVVAVLRRREYSLPGTPSRDDHRPASSGQRRRLPSSRRDHAERPWGFVEPLVNLWGFRPRRQSCGPRRSVLRWPSYGDLGATEHSGWLSRGPSV